MSERVELFGIHIDRVRMDEAVEQLFAWVKQADGHCRYVVTPNVDHAVMFQQHAGLRAAYDDASLILADGHPVVWASRLLGKSLPQRVPGSDLVPQLLATANEARPLRVYLLGAAPGVGDRAAANIVAKWPCVEVVGTFSPPLGFELHEEKNRDILNRVADARPDVLIVGLGAPKQELWVHAHREQIAASVALCVGATIDFLAGEKRRAPKWVQRLGLEWCHRMLSEPRRLIKRYARDAWIFPQLVMRQWWSGLKRTT